MVTVFVDFAHFKRKIAVFLTKTLILGENIFKILILTPEQNVFPCASRIKDGGAPDIDLHPEKRMRAAFEDFEKSRDPFYETPFRSNFYPLILDKIPYKYNRYM
jgi:hypothetical protein